MTHADAPLAGAGPTEASACGRDTATACTAHSDPTATPTHRDAGAFQAEPVSTERFGDGDDYEEEERKCERDHGLQEPNAFADATNYAYGFFELAPYSQFELLGFSRFQLSHGTDETIQAAAAIMREAFEGLDTRDVHAAFIRLVSASTISDDWVEPSTVRATWTGPCAYVLGGDDDRE